MSVMNKHQNISKRAYSAPDLSIVTLHSEGCIANTGAQPNSSLEDLDKNDIYDEDF